MILVTVGNHYLGFDRLVKKMDEIAATTREKVIVQNGSTRYEPVHCEYFDFVEYRKMQQLNREARMIVSHSGVGSILTALELNKPMILVPRLKRFNEVYDDHQLEIAEALAGYRSIRVVYDVDRLPEAVAGKFDTEDACRSRDLVKRLNAYLHGTMAQS